MINVMALMVGAVHKLAAITSEGRYNRSKEEFSRCRGRRFYDPERWSTMQCSTQLLLYSMFLYKKTLV